MACYDRSDDVIVSDEMCSFNNKPSPRSRTCVQTSCTMYATSLFYSLASDFNSSAPLCKMLHDGDQELNQCLPFILKIKNVTKNV